MANVKWFVIVDVATGAERSRASIDLDDPDTAIDRKTGLPYSKSGLKGISHPDVTARKARYERKGASAEIKAIPAAERPAWIAENGGPFEAIEVPFDPARPPVDDPDGYYEVDAEAYLAGNRDCLRLVSGATIRARRLEDLRREQAELEADMAARGEA